MFGCTEANWLGQDKSANLNGTDLNTYSLVYSIIILTEGHHLFEGAFSAGWGGLRASIRRGLCQLQRAMVGSPKPDWPRRSRQTKCVPQRYGRGDSLGVVKPTPLGE
jgi:hypothetical protein